MKTVKTEKIYCYVDETGQDTGGKLFIVVSIVVMAEKTAVEIFLDACETKSGRYKNKWQKSTRIKRRRYVDIALSPALLREKIFWRMYKKSKNYIELTAEMVADSINTYFKNHGIVSGEANIIIDGLNKKEKVRITQIIRQRRIKINKIRGMRDQSNSLIRLADTVAGMVRDASEGSRDWQPVVEKLKKGGVINEI